MQHTANQPPRPHPLVRIPGAVNRRLKRLIYGTQSVDEVALVFDALGHKPGVMLDVGAHHGGSSQRFADNGWQIYAFEPDPKNRQVLMQNLGNRANVTIDARAVLDEPKQGLTLFQSDESTGISSVAAFHPSHEPGETIDATTLREYCDEKSIDAVDFLKVDAEGLDLRVLEGFPWEKMLPKAIVCEFEDQKTKDLGYSFVDLGQYLQERNYRLWVSEWYPIVRYGRQHRWRRFAPFASGLTDDNAWGNFIAFHQSCDISPESLQGLFAIHQRRSRPLVQQWFKHES